MRLVGDFVLAGGAAGLTIVEAVRAEPDIDLALAQDAVFLTFASLFRHLTLRAHHSGFGSHTETLTLLRTRINVPLVTLVPGLRFQALVSK